MRKVLLNMNEENKYLIIKRLVERSGSKQGAAAKLNCTVRNINRLTIEYNKEGKEGFVHKNTNRKPSTAISDETKDEIVKLYKEKYFYFNFTHFTEFLERDHGIKVNVRSVREYLLEQDIVSPKAQRITKRTLKKKLKDQLKDSTKKQAIEINNSIKILSHPDVHPRKPRAKYFGEQIQMDASDHYWIGTEKFHLHTAMDNHSGIIVGAYFDRQETIKGYFNVLKQILEGYGIPALFFTDKRTIFEYKKAPSKKEDTYTQFSYAAHQLGIEMKSSSVPQAKGMIERSYNTLQSRLVAELRLYDIKSLDQANEFLVNFIIRFNKQFALNIDNSVSVFDEKPTPEEINNTLIVINHRVIDSGHSIKYNNKIYIPVDENNKAVYFRSKTKCQLIKTLDQKVYVNVDDVLYSIKEIDKHFVHSKEFDPEVTKKEKKINIPKITHPWRRSTYESFYIKHKKERNGTHVSV